METDCIEVVCLDVNDTLIREKTWPDLSFAMGMTKEENARYYNLHKNKIITYTEWVGIALQIYRDNENLKQKEVLEIIRNYNYFPHARELVEYLKQKYTVVLVSCAMDLLVEEVARELGIEHYKSLTKFFFDKEGFIEEIRVDDRTGNEARNKVWFLEDMCSELGVGFENCVCIGDGSNDYKLFQRIKSITFDNADQEHKLYAWKVVKNLGEIKDIL